MYDSDGDGFITKLDFFEFLYEFGKTYLTDKQVSPPGFSWFLR